VAIDWKRLLTAEDHYQLRPGASAGEVAAVEATLEAAFPAELSDVYRVSDGVFDVTGQWFVIWPLAEVIARNQDAWSEEGSSPRRALVGFGDDGTGEPFCVPRDGATGIFAWSPVAGEAILLADNVAEFWSGWVAGTLPAH
jgi:hypothetical protein